MKLPSRVPPLAIPRPPSTALVLPAHHRLDHLEIRFSKFHFESLLRLLVLSEVHSLGLAVLVTVCVIFLPHPTFPISNPSPQTYQLGGIHCLV